MQGRRVLERESDGSASDESPQGRNAVRFTTARHDCVLRQYLLRSRRTTQHQTSVSVATKWGQGGWGHDEKS